MVRTKLVAILIGPSGVGLVGLYNSATILIGILVGLGIGSSGIREVALAHSSGDPERLAHILKTLRRACWVTGFIGWGITAAFSYPLCLWVFGSGERTWAISLLGITVLLGAVGDGQRALLQGVRRIGDLARMGVYSILISTVVAVILYSWLGEQGIVPVLIISAIINVVVAWRYARKVQIIPVCQSITDSCRNSKHLLGLGLSFMWSGLLSSGAALVVRSMIVREYGIDANGIYQAAWAISGMFAGFIFTAMGTDFFPRLTAVAHENDQVNRLVNEQTEIGILLTLPGLLGTLAFAPWLMHLFYTSAFVAGSELLQWFLLGTFGRAVSWPMIYIQLAKNESKWFAFTEFTFWALHLGLSLLLLHWCGLRGGAMGYFIPNIVYVIGMLWLAAHLSGFRWSKPVIKLLLVSGMLVTAIFVSRYFFFESLSITIGALITATSLIYSLRGFAHRVGSENRFFSIIYRIPGLKYTCTFKRQPNNTILK